MKTFNKMVTPAPPYCFYEILILIFFSLFEGHIFLNKGGSAVTGAMKIVALLRLA